MEAYKTNDKQEGVDVDVGVGVGQPVRHEQKGQTVKKISTVFLRTIRARSTWQPPKLAILHMSLEFRSTINKAGNFDLNQ